MKVLVIGSGGREHAIAKKFSHSPLVDEVFVAPGNPGMVCAKRVAISELDNAALVEFAESHAIDLTFVGPETSLMNGVVDAFHAAGLRIFGPTAAAARIEGSKDFAKSLMVKYGVPTAAFATFTDLDSALAYVDQHGAPIVVKADGLAAGKGVTVAMDIEGARDALRGIFSDATAPATKVVIEEYLEGEEFSLFSFVHNGKVSPMPIAQDHKRAYDGDKGPNTGGMGAYSPVPQIPDSVIDEAIERIVKPTIAGLIAEDCPFTGVLYAGLMLTADGVKTIEFNARFGDPETQVVLPRMTSDFAQVVMDILDDREPEISWLPDTSSITLGSITLGVVVASDGYPASSTKGLVIPELPDDLDVYYAGVAENPADSSVNHHPQLVSNGGRVFLVSATGADVASVQEFIYSRINALHEAHKLDGFFYRHDIGSKAVQ